MTSLPINHQVFRSDAARAFTDAIVGTHRNYENWICGNYIGLRTAMDVFYQEHSLNIRTISPDVYGIPFLDCSRVARQILLGCRTEKWTELLQNALKNGFYVILNCNEFYLPQRAATQAYDYPHSEMIHGFDEQSDAFLVYGFTKSSRYESVAVPAADLFRSIESADCNMPTSFVSSENNLVFVRVNQKLPYACDPQNIMHCISDYVQAKNLLPELYRYFGSNVNEYNPSLLEKYYTVYSKENFIYGLQCYDVAAEWFRSISVGEQPYGFPSNSMYALIEHKQCMLMRLKRFADASNEKTAGIIRSYENDVYDASLIMMNILMKHQAIHNPQCLSAVQNRLIAVKEREKTILTSFLHSVHHDGYALSGTDIAC